MIDKNVITPLYMQVANELRKEVLSGEYGENGCIGTHTQLAERFGVSMITIRKAVQILEKEGMVEILQGKGTFVRRSTLVDPLEKLTGISNMMLSLDMEHQVLVPILELRETPKWMDSDVCEELGEKSLFIRRIICLQGVPIADADMYLPGKYASYFTKEEVENSTVYQIYQSNLGIQLGRGRQVIRAAGADKELARNLEVVENSPVLQIIRKSYDNTGNLIEYMILSYEAGKYCFEVEMDLDPGKI